MLGRTCAFSIFWIVSSLVCWPLPAISKTNSPAPSVQTLEQSDPPLRDPNQTASWPGLPYFNSPGKTEGVVNSDSSGVDSSDSLPSQSAKNLEDSNLSFQLGDINHDLWQGPFRSVPSDPRSVFGDTPSVKLSNVPVFQESTDFGSSPLWRYGKLFSSSAADQGPEGGLDSPYGELPLILTPAVERNIRYFQTVIPDRFQGWLTRFYRYKPAVEQIFKELGIPSELVYLSLVESGFNPRAYSRARAAGPWQFMKATGRIYGLRVNWYIDERRDPVKSSVAAAQHLRDLFDRFGSWPLALAAYNAGSGKISRAIRKAGTRDFWKIAKTRYIRRETRQYVPKFMAATIIASNPTLFGFHAEVPDIHNYDEVLIYNTVHLRAIAKETGIAFEDLRELNPELRRSITPPHKEGYFLKVPLGSGAQVASVREQIAQWKEPPPQVTTYRVRRGDSLSVIAKRFQMSIQKLKDLNNLSGHMIQVGQRLRVSSTNAPDSSSSEDVQWYRVRKGDSLWSIAKRFSVSIGDLKILNNLRSSFIQVGHLLKVSP